MPSGIYDHKLHTEAWKKANSERMKGKKYSLGYKHTDEWKKLASQRMSKENHPMFGKHHSEKTKSLLSEQRKGKPILQLKEYWINRKQTPEHRIKKYKKSYSSICKRSDRSNERA